MRYETHYTRDEARALLPQIRDWLRQIAEICRQLRKLEQRLDRAMQPGRDMGGDLVNSWVRTAAGLRSLIVEFSRRDIEIKDLERGLIDFPAILDGKEVFLCWETSEADICFFHDLDAGYAGRQPLD